MTKEARSAIYEAADLVDGIRRITECVFNCYDDDDHILQVLIPSFEKVDSLLREALDSERKEAKHGVPESVHDHERARGARNQQNAAPEGLRRQVSEVRNKDITV